jgi:citrate lyase subunit beta/citryl-CoA lyase
MSWTSPGPAWLFCPADRPDRYAKAAAAADVVILDLEDAVAPASKPEAREALAASALDPARTIVRVNATGTADLDKDLAALAHTRYQALMLPKCESAQQVCALAPRDVIVLVETPRGALSVLACAEAANTVAVMWGAEDLLAALGGTSSRRADGAYRAVAMHARSAALLAASAAGRLPIDSVYLDIADTGGLQSEADDAVASGFAAKVAIHPSQVPVIRAAFAPSPQDLTWARSVLAAAKQERGVFSYAGRMVDAPVLRHAEALLRREPPG